jgi:Flp pilus assembly protein TadG
MISALVHRLSSFRRDRSGAVAVYFGIMFVPLVVAVGCGIDYGRAARIHTKLAAAADAATLGSIAAGSRAVTESLSMPAGGAIPDGVTDANNIFAANTSNLADMQLGAVQPYVTVSPGGVLTSKINYVADVATTFMNIVGIKKISMSGSVTASINVKPAKPVYADFYLLLDNSPSMGLAATPTEIAKLENLTTQMQDNSCAFACHITSRPLPQIALPTPTPPKDPAGYPLYDTNGIQAYDNYEIARHNGVTLRIDDVVAASQSMVNGAVQSETVANQFRFAAYDYGATADTQGLTNIFALSYDLSGAATAIGKISLMTSTWWGDANDSDTQNNVVLPAIDQQIGAAGDGSSSSTPRKYMFLVSDGVSDQPNSSCIANQGQHDQASYSPDGDRCSMPIDPALCAPLKARGVIIGVVYTTYQPIPTDSYYASFVNPFNQGPFPNKDDPNDKANQTGSINSQIAINMQACASPGMYFEVGVGMDVGVALQNLFQKAKGDAGIPHLQF